MARSIARQLRGVARHKLTRIALIAAVPLAVALLSAGPAAAHRQHHDKFRSGGNESGHAQQ
jgi:hypothetical protein